MVGKEAGDARATFDFLIHAFPGVGGAELFWVGRRQGENGEALRQVLLQPDGEFGRAFGIGRDELLEPLFGRRAVGAVKNTAEGPPDLGPLIQPQNLRLGVLLAVELAALPRPGRADGGAGGLEAEVVVTDDELDAVAAALDQALKKGPPVNLGFAQGDADAEQGALASRSDPQGH